MKCRICPIFIFCYLLSGLSHGAEITTIDIKQQQERYILHIDAQINANMDKVKQIITDFENLPSINPYLKESKVISTTEDGRKMVSMLTEACILFICYKIRHVQIFHLIGAYIVFGHIIPDKSDFKYGWTRWTIRDKSTNINTPLTQITLDGEITPDFFIVPVIGSYQFRKKMIEIATVTINNLEKEAQKGAFSD